KAIELKPDFAYAYCWLVRSLIERADFAGANEACALALNHIAGKDFRLINIALILISVPDAHGCDALLAVHCAKKHLEHVPEATYAWSTLGAAHYRAGNWREAIAALEKSIAMPPYVGEVKGPDPETNRVTQKELEKLAMALYECGDSFDWFFL